VATETKVKVLTVTQSKQFDTLENTIKI